MPIGFCTLLYIVDFEIGVKICHSLPTQISFKCSSLTDHEMIVIISFPFLCAYFNPLDHYKSDAFLNPRQSNGLVHFSVNF